MTTSLITDDGRAQLAAGKYTKRWARLSDDQFMGMLWLLGEFTVRCDRHMVDALLKQTPDALHPRAAAALRRLCDHTAITDMPSLDEATRLMREAIGGAAYDADERADERAAAAMQSGPWIAPIETLTTPELVHRLWTKAVGTLAYVKGEWTSLLLRVEAQAAPPADPAPIPMLLFCPLCHARHLDVGTFATRPHHTHACQGCGHVWRPALVATVGVDFLPGFKDPSP